MQDTDQGNYITQEILNAAKDNPKGAYYLGLKYANQGLIHPREVRRLIASQLDKERGMFRFEDETTGEVEYTRRGLSTAHIFSDVYDYVPAHVEFYDNGDLVRVKRAKLWSRYEQPKGGAKRGEVKSFSAASQRRLKQSLARIDKRKEIPYFVTLTYPDEYPISGSEWKRHLKNLWQRLERQYPKGSFFWVLELKRRKSGINEGSFAPHFHLLVFGVGELFDFMDWLSLNWYEVVDSGDRKHFRAGTNVQLIRYWRRTICYLSKALKYLSKVDVEDLPEEWHVGRFWGVYGRDNIPWAHSWICKLTEKEAIQMIRYLRRFAKIKGRDNYSLSVIADSNQWSKRLEDLLYPG